MGQMMEYNGYRATIRFDSEDEIFVGKVFGINDSLNFHGCSVEELRESFHNCIDNYLEMCKEFGCEPEKEYKGVFNVRVSPELHRKLAIAAEEADMTLNQFVVSALTKSFEPERVSTVVVKTEGSKLFTSAIEKINKFVEYDKPRDIYKKVVQQNARACG